MMIVSALAAAFLVQAQTDSPSCTGTGAEVQSICAVLTAQQDAWNEGDIPGVLLGGQHGAD